MYVDFNKINEYIEDDNGRKYLRLIPVDKNKDKIKNYKKAWNKINCLTKLKNNDSGNYDDERMKIRYNSDNNLLLKQELEILNVVIIIRSFFYDNKKILSTTIFTWMFV